MKKPVLLLALLVVLLGIFWLVNRARTHEVPAGQPFVQVDSAKVNKMQVTASGESVELVKEGDNWTMTRPVNYPAATKTVQSALGKFKDMTRLVIVTDRREDIRRYQVDDSAGTKVSVGDGKKNYVFYLGKISQVGNSYARMDGSNEVWEVAGNNSGTFKRKAKDWRDKTITEFTAADVKKVTLRYPDETLTVEKQDTLWSVSNGRVTFIGQKGPMDRMSNLVSRMQTVDFADTLPPNAFDAPAATITIETNSGSPIELKLIPADTTSSKYFLRKTGATADFIIYKATADVMMKRMDDFKEQPPKADVPKSKTRSKA